MLTSTRPARLAYSEPAAYALTNIAAESELFVMKIARAGALGPLTLLSQQPTTSDDVRRSVVHTLSRMNPVMLNHAMGITGVVCWACGIECPQPNQKCSACGAAYYCSPACQRTDWKEHRQECARILMEQNSV